MNAVIVLLLAALAVATANPIPPLGGGLASQSSSVSVKKQSSGFSGLGGPISPFGLGTDEIVEEEVEEVKEYSSNSFGGSALGPLGSPLGLPPTGFPSYPPGLPPYGAPFPPTPYGPYGRFPYRY